MTASLASAAATLAICMSIFFARDILIVLLLAILFAIFLTKTASAIGRKWGLGFQQSLAIVVCLLLGLGGLSSWLIGSRIQSEIAQASQHIDEAKSQLREKLKNAPITQTLLQQTPILRDWTKSLLAPETQPNPGTSEAGNSKAATSWLDDPHADTELGGEPAIGGAGKSHAQQSSGEEQEPVAAESVSELPGSQVVQRIAAEFFSAVGKAIKTTLGLVLNSLIIFFVGLFLAIAPQRARDGIASFAPRPDRDEWRRVLDCLGDSLWRWLIGRLASMLLTGTGVGIALAVLGVPMPATLGILTGLLTFIPNIGAAIALTLAVFMAIPSGLTTVAWVVAIYLAFQLLESYAVTPLIQQYQVNVPPALLISSQALFGVLLGFLGAMVASPIVVIVLVLKEEVYQRHWLREQP